MIKSLKVFGYAVGAKEPGFVIFGASVKKGESLEKVKDKLIETIEGSLKQKPMTSKELNRTKAQMETMYERAFADPEGFGVGLSEYIALGDWRLFFYGRDKTKASYRRPLGESANTSVATSTPKASGCKALGMR